MSNIIKTIMQYLKNVVHDPKLDRWAGTEHAFNLHRAVHYGTDALEKLKQEYVALDIVGSQSEDFMKGFNYYLSMLQHVHNNGLKMGLDSNLTRPDYSSNS